MTRGLQLTLLFVACLPMGSLYALMAYTCMLLLYGGPSRPWHLPAAIAIIAGAGALCGLLSTAYVVPFLAKSNLRRSVPRVFLSTLIVAGFSGITVFFAPIITLVMHVFFCAQERHHSEATSPGLCPTCNYPLTGLPTPICPECGTDSSLPRAE